MIRQKFDVKKPFITIVQPLHFTILIRNCCSGLLGVGHACKTLLFWFWSRCVSWLSNYLWRGQIPHLTLLKSSDWSVFLANDNGTAEITSADTCVTALPEFVHIFYTKWTKLCEMYCHMADRRVWLNNLIIMLQLARYAKVSKGLNELVHLKHT